jgi:hypothetical protein
MNQFGGSIPNEIWTVSSLMFLSFCTCSAGNRTRAVCFILILSPAHIFSSFGFHKIPLKTRMLLRDQFRVMLERYRLSHIWISVGVTTAQKSRRRTAWSQDLKMFVAVGRYAHIILFFAFHTIPLKTRMVSVDQSQATLAF